MLTPRTVRIDIRPTNQKGKKCGNSYIPANAKCRQGSANTGPAQKPKNQNNTVRKPKIGFWGLSDDPEVLNVYSQGARQQLREKKGIGNKIRRVGETAAEIGGTTAMVGGLLQAARAGFSGNIGGYARGFRNFQLGRGALDLSGASRASRLGKKEVSKEFLKSAGRQAAIGFAPELSLRAAQSKKVRRGFKSAYQSARSRIRRRDSVWVPGFERY